MPVLMEERMESSNEGTVKVERQVRRHARYRCLIGDKLRNAFIAACDLGITGAFEPMECTITWEPGEKVDRKRAQAQCEILKRGINEQGKYECQSVKLLGVYDA